MDGSTNGDGVGTVSFEPAPMQRLWSPVCPGVTAESVSVVNRGSFESRYCGPLHLLIAHERLARRRGTTAVEGLPASNLQNLSRTFTFVPAGCKFSEWHDLDFPSQAVYIHIDPKAALMTSEGRGTPSLPPRLHFQSADLWQTVLKVKALIEDGRAVCSRYADALGVVLGHELLHSDAGSSAAISAARGGLTVWQRRLVAQYVENHLAEQIPLATLAKLALLSRYHFCRAFRQSFGTSPHRYHSMRKMERAKILLADPTMSVTDIALDIGFQETSSFTAVFKKLVGHTPSGFRRSLALKVA